MVGDIEGNYCYVKSNDNGNRQWFNIHTVEMHASRVFTLGTLMLQPSLSFVAFEQNASRHFEPATSSVITVIQIYTSQH